MFHNVIVVHEVYHLKWDYKIKYLPVNGTLRVGGGAWPIRREARLTSSGLFTKSANVLLRCRKQNYTSCILWILVCTYYLLFILFFYFCLLVLCYIFLYIFIYFLFIFLRRTVNKSHLSFTCTGQAITLFWFTDLKRPAVDLQGSTASHLPREHCNIQVWTEQEPEQGVVLHVPRERAWSY